MASGNLLACFTPLANQPPAANYATLDTRNGHLVLDFDASTDEAAIFVGYLPGNYAGGGLTVKILWSATSATSGSCRWQAAIERMEDEGTDLDADSFATAQSTGDTAPSTSGALQYSTITISSGANMDSLVANEAFRLKINRDADGTSGTDDMTGDAEIHLVAVLES